MVYIRVLMISLAFVVQATMLTGNSGHEEASPCHFLMNLNVEM